MSEQDNNSHDIDPNLPPLVNFWMNAFQQAYELPKGITGSVDSGIHPRNLRRQWFDSLSQMTDGYLRSPIFLQMLKSHVETMILAKRNAESLRGVSCGAGNEMAESVQAMRRQMNRLKEQLDSLERMLGGTLEPEQSVSSPVVATNAPRDAAEQQAPDSPGSSGSSEASEGVTPCDVVYREGTMRLLRYRNQAVRFAEPILVCFALVNRPYILDLKEDRSVVRRLLEHGFDVYLVDWGVPDDADRHLRLEDYVGRLLSHAVDSVCEFSGISQLNLLGYCMGGTISTIFTTQKPQRVKNLILMATPIDFAGDDGLLNLWARKEYFDVDNLIDAYGNCPGEFLQFVFQLMKPVQNFAEKQLMFSENLNDATFVDNFVAVERWACDSIPVVGETFRQYVKALYQQNQLVKGQMRLAGAAVRLETIHCPLLLLVAEKDHLVVPDSTLAIQRYVSSRDVQTMSINAGHVGLAVSSKAHRSLWPEAAEWIAKHSTELSGTA